jgi:hypothetical protein
VATPLPPEATAQAFVAPQPEAVQQPVAPTNKYAATGWRRKQSVEFDLQVPSGQWCRVRRLEKNDIFRLRIVDHLDSILPMLVDIGDGADKEKRIAESLKANAHLIDDMYTVIDVVVMACCINPAVTTELAAVNEDADPAIVLIDNIDVDDRMVIFGAAFGRDANELKSVIPTQTGVEPVSTGQVIQLPTE